MMPYYFWRKEHRSIIGSSRWADCGHRFRKGLCPQGSLHGKVSMKTPAWEIMTEEVITVSPQVTIKEAMALMTEKHIRHLPVIERTKIVYLISIGDLVKSIIADQEFMINQLEK